MNIAYLFISSVDVHLGGVLFGLVGSVLPDAVLYVAFGEHRLHQLGVCSLMLGTGHARVLPQ